MNATPRSLTPSPIQQSVSLKSIALLFLKLGTIAFGGPAAHIALMNEEVVRKRAWLTEQEFLDYLSAPNFIPGPNSTEMAIHIGRRRAGWPGLLTAGACFILPAALIVTAIAWAYVRFGTLPQAEGLLYAIKPVVIAVVIQALWKLGRSAIKNGWLAAVAALAVGLIVIGMNELLVLLVGGVLALAVKIKLSQLRQQKAFWIPVLVLSQGVKCGSCYWRRGIVAHVSGFREDRLRSFRQWLCAASVSSRRLRRAVSLAHATAVAGRRSRRAGYAWASLYNRHVRICAAWRQWGACGNTRHFLAGILLCRSDGSAAAKASLLADSRTHS